MAGFSVPLGIFWLASRKLARAHQEVLIAPRKVRASWLADNGVCSALASASSSAYAIVDQRAREKYQEEEQERSGSEWRVAA